ncbi:MAG: response regulator transcription factor [Opitutaceae bacterium]
MLRNPLAGMDTASSVSDLWRSLQAFVRTAFPNHHSATLFLDAKERMPGALTLHSVPARHSPDWWKARSEVTPTHGFLNDHPGIKLYNLADILPPDRKRLRRSEFYRQVLMPEGFDKLLGLTLWEKDERKSILCVRRAFGQPAFSAPEIALLLDLHPIFDRNLRRLEKLEEEKICRSSLQQFINLLPQGILLVNSRYEVIFANQESYDACAMWNLGVETARRMNSRAVFSVPTAFLEAYQMLIERHYVEALGGSELAAPLRTTLIHPEEPQLQADLSLVSLEAPLLARPYLFAQLLNRKLLSSRASPLQDRQFAVLARLTQREREVAALVREGLGNGEIADRLHKSLGTVKNQIQSIFAKLGIDSRARLIWALR